MIVVVCGHGRATDLWLLLGMLVGLVTVSIGSVARRRWRR
jgi:hypothetical protein